MYSRSHDYFFACHILFTYKCLCYYLLPLFGCNTFSMFYFHYKMFILYFNRSLITCTVLLSSPQTYSTSFPFRPPNPPPVLRKSVLPFEVHDEIVINNYT